MLYTVYGSKNIIGYNRIHNNAKKMCNSMISTDLGLGGERETNIFGSSFGS